MLERLSDVSAGIVAVKAVGKVTREDYERVIEPVLAEARREGRRLRFLYQMGPEFEGFTAGAAWEDAKLGVRWSRFFAACAVVTDRDGIRESWQAWRLGWESTSFAPRSRRSRSISSTRRSPGPRDP